MKQMASEGDAENIADEPDDPDRPRPVLPQVAFVLSEYAALELTITADRDGSVRAVIVSMPSRAKLYDEYTRKWVETHWKMPPAKPDEPSSRRFIAPIVYPRRELPAGGSFPPPNYPGFFMAHRMEGFVIVEIHVSRSGTIEDVRILLSSGHKGLDVYTVDWVKTKWKFPPGEGNVYAWPVSYVLVHRPTD